MRSTIPAPNPEVVLLVVQSVGKPGHEVLDLRRANGHEAGNLDVQATAGRHRKGVLRAYTADAACRQQAAEKNLRKGGYSLVAEIHSRPEQIGKRPCGWRSHHVVASEIAYDAQPAVGVVFELTASALALKVAVGGKPPTLAVTLKRT